MTQPPNPRRVYLMMALRCVIVALLANAVFLLVRIGDWYLPRDGAYARIRAAYGLGYLHGEYLYPPDKMVGADQYTDAVTMQLALLGNTTELTNALAPRIASPESALPGAPKFVNRATELKQLTLKEDRTEFRDYKLSGSDTYTRFWHGQSTVFLIAMLFVPIDGYHSLLLLGTLALIAAACTVAARKDGRVLTALLPLFIVGFLFSGQTHFTQLVSYGPAVMACWATVLYLVTRGERLTFQELLIAGVLSGAVEAFLDMMISVPLVAATFLATAGTLLSLRGGPVRTVAWQVAALAAAWSFGFGASYVLKLLLTALALGWEAVFEPFFAQLKFRVGLSDPQAQMPEGQSWLAMIIQNIEHLRMDTYRLGFDNWDPKNTALWYTVWTLVGWAVGVWQAVLAWREGRSGLALLAGLGWFAASFYLLAWVAAFPEHTWRHSWIMVRMVVIWVAAGWGWAAAIWLLRRGAPAAPRGA